MLESTGVPVPGETALIAASVLAAQGLLSLPLVIVVAAAAAIIGDNAGYWIGRAAGRRLLERWRPVARYTEKMLPPAERFFAHHGGKAVFLARFIPGLRVIGALVAGIAGMEWWRFLVWNMAGGVVWATSVALIAYGLGEGVASAKSRDGLIAGGGGSGEDTAEIPSLAFIACRLFFFNDTATTEIYTLSLHDALPISGLRVIGALVAGIAGMEWWRFLVWNMAGGMVWATSVALIAYGLGEAVASAKGRYGLIAGAVVIAAAAVLYALVHGLRRWRAHDR